MINSIGRQKPGTFFLMVLTMLMVFSVSVVFAEEEGEPTAQEVLAQLEAAGDLRPLTSEERDAWVSAASAPYQQFNSSLRVSSYLGFGSYRVQSAITLPDGLTGAHSRRFLIPDGVPFPDGPLGHNTFYFENGSKTEVGSSFPDVRHDRFHDDSALAPFFDNLPAGYEIYAVGTYGGGTRLDVQIDQSGHGVRLAEVVVNKTTAPVVLLLSAYEPTVWNIGVTEGTEIAGVIISGYHRQIALGISAQTPLMISTYREPGIFDPMRAYGAQPELLWMNDRINALSGQDIEHFTYRTSSDGAFLVGGATSEGQTIQYSADFQLGDFLDPDAPLAGQAGLDQLVADGKIRLATISDIDALLDSDERWALYRAYSVQGTYIILEAITLPNGLFGAHSRTFLIPQGVPSPSGSTGHNQFLSLSVSLEDINLIEKVGYDQWATDRGIDSLEGDLDQDGVVDPIEFFMGTDPEDASSKGALAVEILNVNGASHLVLELPLRKNGYGLQGGIQVSSDGVNWNTIGNDFEVMDCDSVSDCQQHLRLCSVAPIDGTSAQFFRIWVDNP